MNDRPTLNSRDVRRRFDRAAAQFDGADFVQATTRAGLLARLEPLLVRPQRILDLGAATGSAGPLLRQRFGRVPVVCVDLSAGMLREARRKRRLFSRQSHVQADATQLPFGDGSFDVVFSNLLLPWVDAPERVFGEVARVLCDGGVFAFSTLGPDSLRQLARAWHAVDSSPHVRQFADMHNVGDALVRTGIRDPVLDVDRLSVRYTGADRLFEDLRATGARNTLRQRERGLCGKTRFGRFRDALAGTADDGLITLDLELVYGHGWRIASGNRPVDIQIDATRIPRRQRPG